MNKFKMNKNIGKKFALYTLIGSISGFTLMGCGKKEESFLEGTVLENAVVISFEDGTKEVSNKCGFCSSCTSNYTHEIYQSVVSKEYFVDDDCKSKWYLPNVFNPFNKYSVGKYSIVSIEGITGYLTDQELMKAGQKKLTDADIAEIVVRIHSTQLEEQKELVKN